MSNDELIRRAREVATRAYAPYSGFRVGAIAVAADGSVYEGVNVENAAYPSGVCAEASAISAAATAGVRTLETMAVACIDAPSVDDAYPCGQCRQRMLEFDVDGVLVAAGTGDFRTHRLAELLPHGFRL
jgi:cytidine deaminase